MSSKFACNVTKPTTPTNPATTPGTLRFSPRNPQKAARLQHEPPKTPVKSSASKASPDTSPAPENMAETPVPYSEDAPGDGANSVTR